MKPHKVGISRYNAYAYVIFGSLNSSHRDSMSTKPTTGGSPRKEAPPAWRIEGLSKSFFYISKVGFLKGLLKGILQGIYKEGRGTL